VDLKGSTSKLWATRWQIIIAAPSHLSTPSNALWQLNIKKKMRLLSPVRKSGTWTKLYWFLIFKGAKRRSGYRRCTKKLIVVDIMSHLIE
jgi:hypothetical protein